jgi:hypothetical protein
MSPACVNIYIFILMTIMVDFLAPMSHGDTGLLASNGVSIMRIMRLDRTDAK